MYIHCKDNNDNKHTYHDKDYSHSFLGLGFSDRNVPYITNHTDITSFITSPNSNISLELTSSVIVEYFLFIVYIYIYVCMYRNILIHTYMYMYTYIFACHLNNEYPAFCKRSNTNTARRMNFRVPVDIFPFICCIYIHTYIQTDRQTNIQI